MNDDIDVIALVKGRERYIFLYDAASYWNCVMYLHRFASCPELSFNREDAGNLWRRMRAVKEAMSKGELT